MKSVYILIVLALVGCTTKQTQVAFQPSANRTPSQVTGNYGNALSAKVSQVKSIYVKFNTTDEVINSKGKVISSEQKTWSPCPMQFIDVRYNGHDTAGSCTGFTFGEGLEASRLGVKVNVNYTPEDGYTSQFQIGINDTAYTVVKRLEDTLDLSKPFYNKFDGQLFLREGTDGKNITKTTLNSVELANSHYYAAGAKDTQLEQVNFEKIAEDFAEAHGGLKNLIIEQRDQAAADRLKVVTQYTHELNAKFKWLKKNKKKFSPKDYNDFRDVYVEEQKMLEQSWANVVKDNPELASKRVRIVTDE